MSRREIKFLDILLGDELVGRLSKMGDVIQFLGEPEYLENRDRPTLSLSMNGLDPLHGDEATRRAFGEAGTQWTRSIGRLPAFFENLLPEGALREMLAQARGVSVDDQFELLAACGGSLTGAVVARPSSQEELDFGHGQAHVKGLMGADDEACWSPVKKPMTTGFSLAGQQMKLAVSMDPGTRRYTLKTQDARGVDIVAKMPSREHPQAVELEFSGLSLAHAAGVNTPPFWMDDATRLDVPNIKTMCPGGSFLAIERFDRPHGGKGHSIHIEDWCQLTGRRPMEKYAPEWAFVLGLRALRAYSPERFSDAQEFIRRQVVNVLMGNTDAHLKNFSMLYKDGRHPSLSPAYDLVPIIAYLGDGRYALNEKVEEMFQKMRVADFERVGHAAGFAPKAVAKEVRETVERVRATWPSLLRELPLDPKVSRKIEQRLDNLPLVKEMAPTSAPSAAPRRGMRR
jgi:serine/threonine-protein kinase HipA